MPKKKKGVEKKKGYPHNKGRDDDKVLPFQREEALFDSYCLRYTYSLVMVHCDVCHLLISMISLTELGQINLLSELLTV
jgi:hypothetical protein